MKMSFEEAGGLEKKKGMMDLKKERRRTEVEGKTDLGVAGSWFTRRATPRSRNLEEAGRSASMVEVKVSPKSFSQKSRAVVRRITS